MGHSTGGRERKPPNRGAGPDCERQAETVCTTCLIRASHVPHLLSLLAPAAAIRRTIIRHLILVLDLSSAMMDRDMRPTRFDLMLQYAREFITEWFDQNPLGQIGIVGMRSGIGERIGEMSGEYCVPLRLTERLADKQMQVIPKISSKRSRKDIKWNQTVNRVCRMRLRWHGTP